MSEQSENLNIDVKVTTPADVAIVEEVPVVEVLPEVSTEVEDQAQKAAEKTFTQEDLDYRIDKRLAKERRKWERDQEARVAEYQAKQAALAEIPPVEAFKSSEEHAKWISDYVDHEISRREVEKSRVESQTTFEDMRTTFKDRMSSFEVQHPDFRQVALNDNVPYSDLMTLTIMSSDIGPDLAYYLGNNVGEASRIFNMPDYLQAKEIGRIEANILANPIIKKVSSATAPISPVTPNSHNSKIYDTTRPEAAKDLSMDDWVKYERQRERKRTES